MNLLLAAVLLSQNQKPQDILNRLYEPIEKAKTLQVKSTWRFEDPASSQFEERSSIWLMKDGNKIHDTASSTFRGRTTAYTGIINGARVWVSDIGIMKDSPRLPTGYQKAIALLGFRYANIVGSRFSSAEEADDRYPDLGKILEPARITSGPDEAGAAMLSYQINLKSPKDTFTYLAIYKVKVWYEPKTMKLLKRTVTCEDGSSLTIETYEEFTLNPDIPDEKFKIPEEKK